MDWETILERILEHWAFANGVGLALLLLAYLTVVRRMPTGSYLGYQLLTLLGTLSLALYALFREDRLGLGLSLAWGGITLVTLTASLVVRAVSPRCATFRGYGPAEVISTLQQAQWFNDGDSCRVFAGLRIRYGSLLQDCRENGNSTRYQLHVEDLNTGRFFETGGYGEPDLLRKFRHQDPHWKVRVGESQLFHDNGQDGEHLYQVTIVRS